MVFSISFFVLIRFYKSPYSILRKIKGPNNNEILLNNILNNIYILYII